VSRERTDDFHDKIVAACLSNGREPLPECSLAEMLEIEALVAAAPRERIDGGTVLRVHCAERLVAAVFALQRYGGIDGLAEALGYGVSSDASEVESCEHGIAEGEFCDPCNRAYKDAAADPDNGNG
jgi:hypothetical protein